MEIAIITGIGIIVVSSIYKIGYEKGKKSGYELGYNHGMFRANKLINERTLEHQRPRTKIAITQSSKEPVWLG